MNIAASQPPKTASHIPLGVLERWGMGTVDGLPRDGINGIMGVLRQRQDELGINPSISLCTH